ncbi:MAG: NAD-dependent epimerase/dehydratase family protein [Thermodesulfobacteriota bacterium]
MIYLTGASGFVGRNLLTELIGSGRRIRALILPDDVAPIDHPDVEWIRGDVRRIDSLERHLDDVEIVIHNAGIVASPDEQLNHEVNYIGTRNIVESAKLARIKKLIFVSAAAVKFKQLNAYGKSKKMAEELVASSGLPSVILRLPLIIGRGSYEFDQFVKYVNTLPFVVPVFGDGKAIKRPVHISDVVHALVVLIDKDEAIGKIYEVSCRERITLDEFIDAVCERLDKKKIKLHIPLGLSLFMAQVAEGVMGKRSPITQDILLGMNEDVEFDVEEALKELKLEPLTVENALRTTLS